MPFKKGQSGNPKGRPQKGKAETDELRKAIKLVEGRKKKKFLIHVIERSFENDQVAIAVLKKLIPDLRYSEHDLGVTQGTMAMVVEAIQGLKNGKSKKP